MRYLISATLFLVGALLALYGLFALLYTGEGLHPGPTYVPLAGPMISTPIAWVRGAS
jgi:hypothetical protein